MLVSYTGHALVLFCLYLSFGSQSEGGRAGCYGSPAPKRSKEEAKEEPRGMREIFSACQDEGETEEEAGQVFLHAATFGVALDDLLANVGE